MRDFLTNCGYVVRKIMDHNLFVSRIQQAVMIQISKIVYFHSKIKVNLCFLNEILYFSF